MCRGSCNIEGSWRATQKNDPPPPNMHGVNAHNLYWSGDILLIFRALVPQFSLCFFATLPISSLSGPSGSISLYLSFPFPFLIHPFILLLSLSQLALGLRPGGLSAPEDRDGLRRCLCQWCRAATGPDLCPVHFIHRFHSKRGRQKISEWIMTVYTSADIHFWIASIHFVICDCIWETYLSKCWEDSA